MKGSGEKEIKARYGDFIIIIIYYSMVGNVIIDKKHLIGLTSGLKFPVHFSISSLSNDSLFFDKDVHVQG